MWFVYILECADGSYYTGATNDLAKRLVSHNAGRGARYTRSRLPVKFVYTEKVISHSEALKREIAVKKLSRQDKADLINRKIF